MSHWTKPRTVKARKAHTCDLCGGPVSKGADHITWVYYAGGAEPPWRAHVHVLCDRAAPLFDLYDGEEWTCTYPLWESLRDYEPAELLEKHPGPVGEWLAALLERAS